MATAGARRVKCILSINTGDGIMGLVQPSSSERYPEWKAASPVREPGSASGEGEELAAALSISAAGETGDARSQSAGRSPTPTSPGNSPYNDESSTGALDGTAPDEGEPEEDSGLRYVRECTRRAQAMARKTTMTGLSLQEGETPSHLESIMAQSSLIRPFVDDDGVVHDFTKTKGQTNNQPYSPHHKVQFHSKLPVKLREKVTKRDTHVSSTEELEGRILGGIEKETPPPELTDEKRAEDDILNAEFLTCLWAQHVFVALAGRCFGRAFIEKYARENITSVIAPFVQRRMRRWEQMAKTALLVKERFEKIKKPRPQVLRVINTFFVDWPSQSIEDLIERMTPASWCKGEVLFHEGDYCTNMYLVSRGAVEIIVRDGHCVEAPKSRARKNGVTVAVLNQGELVGDNALLNYGEARCATAFCSTDVDAWCISRKDFIACSAMIPPISHLRFRRMADDKRKSNIANVFPVKNAQLEQQQEFRGFHTAGIQFLASKFTPQIYRSGDELMTPTSVEPAMFLIVTGSVRLQPVASSPKSPNRAAMSMSISERTHLLNGSVDSTPSSTLGKSKGRRYDQELVYRKGDILGIHETICNEQVQATFEVHEGPLEVWQIERQDWLDVAREYPQCAVGAMEEIRTIKSQDLPIATESDDALTDILISNPLVQYCIPLDILRQVWGAHAVLELYRQGSPLFHAGDSTLNGPNAFIFVVEEGSLYDGYTRDALSRERETVKMYDVEQSAQVNCAQAGYVVVDSTKEGYAYGLTEFALQEEKFKQTVKCASHCRIWKIRRSILEEAITAAFPFVIPQIVNNRKIILDHMKEGNRLSDLVLLPDGPTKLLRKMSVMSRFSSFRSGSPRKESVESQQ